MILPLAAGVVVATIVSHDPAIELQLTLPNKYHTTTIRRLLLIMAWTAIMALLSSAVIFFLQLWYAPTQLVTWSLPWQFLMSQLTWLAPLFWFVAVGLCLAMLTRSRTASGSLLCVLWFTFVCLAVISGILRGYFELLNNPFHYTVLPQILRLTSNVNAVFPICIGILLADRLPRDRRTKMDELFYALPCTLGTRLTGKYIGTTLATLLPMVLFYALGVACILYQSHDLLTLPLALLTFVAIALPGILFVSAFSIACTAFLWVPLYQFLFVGYWFWGNLLPPSFGIPTLSATLLTPVGNNMLGGFFGGDSFPVTHATALQGVESTLLLLGIALLVMAVLWHLLRWEQARQ